MRSGAVSLDSLIKKYEPKPLVSLDARYTRAWQKPARTSGIKAGVELNGKTRLGLAYYWLKPGVVSLWEYRGNMHYASLHMNYLTAYADYTFYKSYRWELRLPVQIGLGASHWTTLVNDERRRFEWGGIVSIEPGVGGHYRVWRWIGLSAEAGYRQMLLPGLFNTRQLSGPFISFGLKIFFGELYQDFLKYKEEPNEEGSEPKAMHLTFN